MEDDVVDHQCLLSLPLVHRGGMAGISATLLSIPAHRYHGSMLPSLAQDARAIFSAALERVDPLPMMARALALHGDQLSIRTETEALDLELGAFHRIIAFGAGKASARMALGLEAVLGDRLRGGVVVVKTGHIEALARIELLEAAHPVPDVSSLAAAERLLALGREADAGTLFLGLTSGGGSALLCAPAEGVSLDDKREATRLLLGCGASIQEVNTVRKHLSAIKGGRLAEALAPGTVVNLILSDVIDDDLSAIASGPTAPDPTTFGDALALLERYRLLDRIPRSVRRHLEEGHRGLHAETPTSLPRSRNLILGGNRQALLAAQAKAEALGYATQVLPAPLTGEARDAGPRLLALARQLRPPACLLAGGETTVTLRGDGKGGRNQELALSVLAHCERDPERLKGILLLSAGTDGNDGPTDSAGAFATETLLARAKALHLSPTAYLDRNDAYPFFDHVQGHLKTGPTNTNVCDVQIVLVDGGNNAVRT